MIEPSLVDVTDFATFSTMSGMESAENFTAATLVERKAIYVTSSQRKVFRLNINLQGQSTWSTDLPNMHGERKGCSVCAVGSRLFVIGGSSLTQSFLDQASSFEMLETDASEL